MGKAIEVRRPTSVGTSVRHMLRQVEHGRTLAAADHILICQTKSDLHIIIQEFMNELPEFITNHPGVEEHVFEAMIRIGLNLVGRDVYVARIPAPTVEGALEELRQGLSALESRWGDIASSSVNSYIATMSSVNSGDSLPAFMAEKIQKGLAGKKRPSSFIEVYGIVARQTVYWKIIEEGYCKCGNDYARGLETLRHLGFSQVSTNPVLAAKAFDEDPSLEARLLEQITKNPEWKQHGYAHGHEMAMAGTLLALWPNLEVFRPLAVLVDNMDFMISFQLNPNLADDFRGSVEDAKRAYMLARQHLTTYDEYLGLENPGSVPPNIVFKVAGSGGTARQITREFNASGIGTNNTVTFTVAQEVQLIIDALQGKAEAIKARRQVTRTYETNMGGRFVSHLREEEAKRIVLEVASRIGEDEAARTISRLAKKLRLPNQEAEQISRATSIAAKADLVCSYKYMKSLTLEAFLEAALEAGLTEQQVHQLEMDLRKAGTLIARRVYSIFYAPECRVKWVEWLERQHKLRHEEAALILDSMDILPASKRIPEDTFDTLVSMNMCNTEFPNHAKAVQLFSERPGFDLVGYRQAALQVPDSKVVARLMSVRDFARGYESTEQLSQELLQAKIPLKVEEFGMGGISENEWHEFGSVKKTMTEFKEAYDRFFERCVSLASGTR